MIAFQTVTDLDLQKAKLFNRARLNGNGCWIWTGPMDAKGYGFVGFKGKDRRAHRVSYETFIGPIPTGLVICHECDTPSCINPNHLRADTMKGNMADRDSRGRRDVKGEQIGTSVLTEDQVIEIKQSKKGTSSRLANRFGVTIKTVCEIRAGKSWKHLNHVSAQ